MSKSSDFGTKIEIVAFGTSKQPAVARIGQHEYVGFNDDPNTIPILEDFSRELLLKDLPLGISITPCKRLRLSDEDIDLEGEIPILPTQFEGIAPFRVFNSGNNHAGLIIRWHCEKTFWKNHLGHHWQLEQARKILLSRQRKFPGLRFHQFIDQGYLAGIEFITFLKSNSLESLIESAYDLSDRIRRMIENSLGAEDIPNQSEASFTQGTFIPLLKKLGFEDVVYYHGSREFGRDVIFSRQTEFGIPEYWAAQVKLGNVSGKVNSYLDLIVKQAEEAFKIPLFDIRTKSKIWISKFVVAITGRYTENAVEKICQKIESSALRNNILFLDGETLYDLRDRNTLSPSSQDKHGIRWKKRIMNPVLHHGVSSQRS